MSLAGLAGWLGCLDFQKLMEEEINKELRFFYFKKFIKNRQPSQPSQPCPRMMYSTLAGLAASINVTMGGVSNC